MKKNKLLPQSRTFFFYCAVFILFSHSELAFGFAVTTTNGSVAIKWPTPSAGVYINTEGFPAGSLQAIQSALQSWTDVSSSTFSFAYAGSTQNTAYGDRDGMNLLCFGPLDGEDYASTLAVNTFWFSAAGELIDSDIKFNASFSWAVNVSEDAFDVQTLALHELGHSLSLDDLYDSGDAEKVMYGYCRQGQIKRALTQDDKNGITFLYPGSSTTTTISVPCPVETLLGQDNPDLESLRDFRDGPLARSAAGRRLTGLFYAHAESINAALTRSPAMQTAARKFFELIALMVRTKN